MHADDRSTQVIVHEFQVGKVATAGDFSNSAIPETSVFQVASKLARDAICETGWKNLHQRCLKSEFTPQANACFIWAQEPPRLSDQEKVVNQYKTLKSWGDPISEEELVSLSELDEYEHVQQTSLDGTLPAKKLFSGSLYGVIPQPHFYSSASDNATIRDGVTEIPPYKKTKPITIPPYGDNISQLSHPLSGFARTAWIIPVRGSLPWAFCTPAVVLNDSNTVIGKDGILIQWTNTTLVKFWHFLKNVREAGNLGQVGLSFHVATARERGESWLSAEVVHEPTNSAHGELQVWSRPLSSIDYVKVYHKASSAMSLRNILDAWAYVCPDGRKSRVLKGSRLALVDERCRGILVS